MTMPFNLHRLEVGKCLLGAVSRKVSGEAVSPEYLHDFKIQHMRRVQSFRRVEYPVCQSFSGTGSQEEIDYG